MTPVPAQPAATALRTLAPGLLLIAALLLLFRETAAAMVAIWIRSETFAHAFLVVPIVLWMIWRRRETLATLTPRPVPWVVLPMAAICLLWLLGELVGVNAATQFALVALLVLSVPAVFGWAVTGALLFPLMFLFFAVPFGEFMVPSMMSWTADFTVSALQLTGVPVFREGLQFVIPSGNWSVVEACSGVRYLIASFMVGTLFAYLNFRTPGRRAAFILTSLLVPILANWVRAYLIVMLGHLSGNKLAAGVDHIIYGWVFFGLVIGVMFTVGARFGQAPEPVPVPVAGSGSGGVGRRPAGAAWGVSGGVIALLAATQFGFWRLDHGSERPTPVFAFPAAWEGAWQPAGSPLSDWTPAFKNASAQAEGTWVSGGAAVSVWVGYYRNQGYDRKLVSSTNTMTDMTPEATWSQVTSGSLQVPASGGLAVRTADLRGPPALGSSQPQRLRAWQFYWIGGRTMTSDVRARLQLAFDRLLGQGDDGAVIFITTRLPEARADEADATLSRFLGPNLAALTGRLQAARSGP
jgi:exosortase A